MEPREVALENGLAEPHAREAKPPEKRKKILILNLYESDFHCSSQWALLVRKSESQRLRELFVGANNGGLSNSKVKVKATDLPPIDHLPNTGTQTHYPPPGFDNAFSGNYYGVLECFYYNQRIDGIQRANNFIQVSRNGHPLEHATATILRCLFDLHHDIKAEPHIITNRNVDEIPRTTLEGSIATVAIGTYHSYGEAVMTGARKSEQGRYKQKYIEKFFNNFLPFLTSIHKACDPVIILGSGSQAVMSDLQVSLLLQFYYYAAQS